MLLLNGKLLEFLQFHLVTCSLPLMILSYAWFKFRFMVNIFFLTEVQYISKTPMYYTCRRWAVVEAREGNRVLPSACSSIFNNIKLSVHIFLKYKGGIPGASPIWATCWKGESAFSDLSSFQNLSLLIDSYHCLLVDAVSSGRGVFGGYLLSHHSFISEYTSLRKSEHLPPCWQLYQGRTAVKWVRLVVL